MCVWGELASKAKARRECFFNPDIGRLSTRLAGRGGTGRKRDRDAVARRYEHEKQDPTLAADEYREGDRRVGAARRVARGQATKVMYWMPHARGWARIGNSRCR